MNENFEPGQVLFCSGVGQYHSVKNPTNPQEYLTISGTEVEDMAENPPSVPKSEAQWAIFSTLPSRVHSIQREHGQYGATWLDIDKNSNDFKFVVETIRRILPGTKFISYLTRSATPENHRCRVIIPYDRLCPGNVFIILQKIINDRIEKAGILPDRKTEAAGQICYLPNRGAYHQYHIEPGTALNWETSFSEELAKERDRQKMAGIALKARRDQARQRSVDRTRSGEVSPQNAYNEAYDIEDCLLAYGYKQHGTRYLSPNSSSGSPGVSIKDGKWVSSHESDRLTVGAYGDAFDLFTFYEHNGDRRAALKAAGETFIVDGVSLARANQRNYMVTDEERRSELFRGYQQVESAAEHQKSVESEEWPEPQSLIVRQPADIYPMKALPGVIGAAVSEVVRYVQCPFPLGACSALAVISTVGQGLVDVRRACKLDGPTSLYILAIADSGERKTTVDNFFLKPVQQWQMGQAEAAKPELKKYEAESKGWEAKKAGLLAAIKDAAKGGKPSTQLERTLIDLEEDQPHKPKVPRLLVSDATPEALSYRLAHEWPVAGVLSSEAGIVFGGHAMNKESVMRNMALINSLWGAESMTIDRRSAPSYTLRHARLTMGLAVQPEAVKIFQDGSKGLARGIGFFARFLIAWPQSTQGERKYQEPPEHWPNLAKFHQRLGELLDLELSIDDQNELSPTMLELSQEAKLIWIAFHDEVEAELKPGRDMSEARDVASKAADNAARLAALFHLFENGLYGTIGADHMKAAADIVTWHLYEAKRFMGEIALPVEINNAVRLDDWLLEHCRSTKAADMSTRDLQRFGPNCIRDKKALGLALDELIEAGRVQVVKDGRRKIVAVNPALLGGDRHGIT